MSSMGAPHSPRVKRCAKTPFVDGRRGENRKRGFRDIWREMPDRGIIRGHCEKVLSVV